MFSFTNESVLFWGINFQRSTQRFCLPTGGQYLINSTKTSSRKLDFTKSKHPLIKTKVCLRTECLRRSTGFTGFTIKKPQGTVVSTFISDAFTSEFLATKMNQKGTLSKKLLCFTFAKVLKLCCHHECLAEPADMNNLSHLRLISTPLQILTTVRKKCSVCSRHPILSVY